MTFVSKRNISGIVCLVCAVCMVFCIGQMVPYGLSGDVAKVKLYFILMIPACLIGLPFGVAYYYYRGKQGDYDDLGRTGFEVAALAQAGRKKPATTETERIGEVGRSRRS